MVACTLTDIVSWFSCAQQAYFAELMVIVIFVTAFSILKTSSIRESLPAALFIATFAAGAFYGMGVINPLVPVAGIVAFALSVVFLSNQNATYG